MADLCAAAENDGRWDRDRDGSMEGFAFAALSNDRERITVAQQVSINYLSPVKGDRLIATARYKKDGRNSCVVNVDVADDTGREIAQFVGTGFKLK